MNLLTKLAVIWGLLSYTDPKNEKLLAWLSYLMKLQIREMKVSSYHATQAKINKIMDDIEKYGRSMEVKQDNDLVYNYIVLFAEDALRFVTHEKKQKCYNRFIELSIDKYNPTLVECERAEEFNECVNLIVNRG